MLELPSDMSSNLAKALSSASTLRGLGVLNEVLRRRFGFGVLAPEESSAERAADWSEFARLLGLGGRQSGWPQGTCGPDITSMSCLVSLVAMMLIVGS